MEMVKVAVPLYELNLKPNRGIKQFAIVFTKNDHIIRYDVAKKVKKHYQVNRLNSKSVKTETLRKLVKKSYDILNKNKWQDVFAVYDELMDTTNEESLMPEEVKVTDVKETE